MQTPLGAGWTFNRDIVASGRWQTQPRDASDDMEVVGVRKPVDQRFSVVKVQREKRDAREGPTAQRGGDDPGSAGHYRGGVDRQVAIPGN